MIELIGDRLVFRFPEVHPRAELSIDFQRTLRIPDDDRDHPLPPGLGCFPLRHVDDFAGRVPGRWVEHGGVMMPMYQSEAMWLHFDPAWIDGNEAQYPFVIKIAAGKINAVSGEEWRDGIHRDPQDYMVAPGQPWLDGYCVQKGIIRQFVAMPLGSGYSAEEQVTGKGEHGGAQIEVFPMKREVFERRFPKRDAERARYRGMSLACLSFGEAEECAADMGLAAGGRMKQEIYDDPYDLADWDTRQRSRCFVHLCNSLVWRAITGAEPPTTPPTAREYTAAGLPWFDYYADAPAVPGSPTLAKVKSVTQLAKEKGDKPLPENEPVDPKNVVAIRKGLGKGQVREW